MPESFVMWVLISLILICCVCSTVLFAALRRVQSRLSKSLELIDDLHKITLSQKQSADDLAQESAHMNEKLAKENTDLAHKQGACFIRLEKLEATVERLEEQDPALKMYSKATKLVEQGVEMADIIEASGLSRAEVEVLLSLHAKK